MLFHEIYGCYYHAVARILSSAINGTLTEARMKEIIAQNTFSESFLTILPALEQERWQLLDSTLQTPLKHIPTLPLSTLELRWLKAVSLDSRIRLFQQEYAFLMKIAATDIPPLFTPSDYVNFDQYEDGDPYEDIHYINIFHTILTALRTHKKIKVSYLGKKGIHRTFFCSPYRLEYSEKDDKFRLLIGGCRFTDIINVGRIETCELQTEEADIRNHISKANSSHFILELEDRRNALERVMLHFAHFEKEARRLSDDRYQIIIRYNREDETELVIRVLSFGPFIKITEPDSFIELIKERLIQQKSCGPK
ncbi:MAG: WYL domain-containing protein [Lachnospiraceae bacterium]|nr:WYL domain-containing protein [Lachnospiraceae bacterium]